MGIIPKVRHTIREKKLRTAASEKKNLWYPGTQGILMLDLLSSLAVIVRVSKWNMRGVFMILKQKAFGW